MAQAANEPFEPHNWTPLVNFKKRCRHCELVETVIRGIGHDLTIWSRDEVTFRSTDVTRWYNPDAAQYQAWLDFTACAVPASQVRRAA